MSTAPQTAYVTPSRGLVAGAVFLHVPIPYLPERPMPVSVITGGLLQAAPNFERAWQDAPPRFREVGLPTLTPTKPRPVVILVVGAAEEDSWHRENAWVAPRYSHKELRTPRQGRNVFDLPAAPEFGLDADGFLDFFQVVTIPLTYLQGRHHRCDLSAAALNTLLTAFRACLLP